MSELERALSRLDKLLAWSQEHEPEIARNEAATRLHLIDRLLLNVLGWPRHQVAPEDAQDGTFADYVLGDPRQLVVEAKREGKTFVLPPETPIVTDLPTLFRLDSGFRAVVEQARRYAYERGLPYACVSNGHQLVAFLAVRTDGVAPLRGRALAFPSLEAMRSNFGTLWNALSKVGVEGRRLANLLSGSESAPPPSKLSNMIGGYPGFQTPGDLETDLKILGELFLIDLVEQEEISDEFLRQCYCSNGALSQYAAVSRDILKARYS
ncbi:MAG: hypothetical protein M3020_07285 [Myxococcota bacterium]|nr:hypothetical protein [Myxococcota bacterium]